MAITPLVIYFSFSNSQQSGYKHRKCKQLDEITLQINLLCAFIFSLQLNYYDPRKKGLHKIGHAEHSDGIE